MVQPEWMAEAWRQLGTRERPGGRHNRAILDLFRDVGRRDVTRDEVPWCAAFVGACLERAGHGGTGSLLARSYLGWGDALERPRPGAIVVLSRGTDPGAGHVGFWLGETDGAHVLLSGNQRDAVTVARFAKHRLLGVRWPQEESMPASAAASLTFRDALQHVLEMEGGFTDDPVDPGGPTNKGITLKVFCRHTGRALHAGTRGQRIAELRGISDQLVAEIYRQRYWHRSRAAGMPAAIGFMHFDASVNHGPAGAACLLQSALNGQAPDLDIDGEIGPLTLAAARRADLALLLSAYGDARRAKYRSLRHFWKFGRGWLNRVARTEARARKWLAALPTPTPWPTSSPPTKGNDMTMIEPSMPAPKWWGSSMTIWGAAITALSTVLPVIGPAFGVDVTPDVVRQAGEQVIAVVQAVGGLAGILLTVYGRTRAAQPLERRRLEVRI